MKFDPLRALHHKLCASGFAARGLDEAACCLVCADGTPDGKTVGHELDALLSDERLMLLGFSHGEKTPTAIHRLAKVLVANKRWERDDKLGGYWIHDYLVQNWTGQRWAEYIAGRQANGERSAQARAERSAQALAAANAATASSNRFASLRDAKAFVDVPFERSKLLGEREDLEKINGTGAYDSEIALLDKQLAELDVAS